MVSESNSNHNHNHGECHDHGHGHHPPERLVTVQIGEVTKRIPPGLYTVADIKRLGDVPLADQLEDAHLNPLPDDGSVKIHHDTKFFACPRVGVSS